MYHVSCRGSIQLLCYCPREGNDHEHICKLLIHYDANNSLELPDRHTAVSTCGARRQHGGQRSKRGAVVGRAIGLLLKVCGPFRHSGNDMYGF